MLRPFLTFVGVWLVALLGPAVTGAPATKPPTEGTAPAVSFLRDVLPVLSKSGCNAGSCHAKATGQNGFHLTIFAYDPTADYREIVKEARGRRVFPALPELSLLLQKPTQAVEHEGGKRFKKDSDFYKTIAAWIAQGMAYQLPGEPELKQVTVTPRELAAIAGKEQPLKVEALYSDGSKRDVTALAHYQSNDKAFASVDDQGVVRVGNYEGETVIIARYMGLVDISSITVPSKKRQAAGRYADLPVHNQIDRLVYRKLERLGILPSDLCTDAEFVRRATLSATGSLPSPTLVKTFLIDSDPRKREKWIDRLLNDPAWANHWATKWADLIRPNPARVGVKSVFLLDQWIRASLQSNKPYDQFVRELLTAQGSTHKYGPAVLFRDKRDPDTASGFVSQIFLGVRMECAKCHHHPNEKWDVKDYYQLSAFFARKKRKGQGISAPISGEPEYVWVGESGSIKHPFTGVELAPQPPGGHAMEIPAGGDPRAALVDWMVDPANPFFARAIVNRIWGELLGKGIVNPVDDFRSSNPPSNGELLDWLAQDFVEHGYDLKHLMRTIMRSRVYQFSSLPNDTNVRDTANFSRFYRKRLPAEVLLDAVGTVTSTGTKFEGTFAGTRAIQTWNNNIDSYFMDAFGRPNSSAECPCERNPQSSVVQALHLMNSPTLQSKLNETKGTAEAFAASNRSNAEVVEEFYLLAYSRRPTDAEAKIALKYLPADQSKRKEAVEDLLWALINSAEFVFNH